MSEHSEPKEPSIPEPENSTNTLESIDIPSLAAAINTGKYESSTEDLKHIDWKKIFQSLELPEETNVNDIIELYEKHKDEGVDEFYEIEKLIDRKTIRRKTTYLVLWKGYPAEDASWMPAEEVPDEMVMQYEEMVAEQQPKPKPKPKSARNAAARKAKAAKDARERKERERKQRETEEEERLAAEARDRRLAERAKRRKETAKKSVTPKVPRVEKLVTKFSSLSQSSILSVVSARASEDGAVVFSVVMPTGKKAFMQLEEVRDKAPQKLIDFFVGRATFRSKESQNEHLLSPSTLVTPVISKRGSQSQPDVHSQPIIHSQPIVHSQLHSSEEKKEETIEEPKPVEEKPASLEPVEESARKDEEM